MGTGEVGSAVFGPSAAPSGPGQSAERLTDQEAELLRRAREAFVGGVHLRARTTPADMVDPAERRELASDSPARAVGSGATIEARVRRVDREAAGHADMGDRRSIEHLLAESFAIADTAIGAFEWPSGVPFWANDALEHALDATGSGERTLVSLLDEWSQAHFLVRALPDLLRRGSWRGQLGFAVALERSEPMLVTLVAHANRDGATDALSLLAVPSGEALTPAERATRHVDDAVTDVAAQLVSALVEHISDLIVVAEPDGTISFASPAATALLGLPAGGAPDDDVPDLLTLLHPDDRPSSLAALATSSGAVAQEPRRLRVRAADGTWRHLAAVLTDLTESPTIGGFVLNARDVTEVVAAEEAVSARAFRDELTGLANQVRLLDRLEGLAGRGSAGRAVLVALRVADPEGAEGVVRRGERGRRDDVIRAVGAQLGRCVSELGADALAVRLQGGDFAVLVPGIGDPDEAMHVATHVQEAADAVRSAAGAADASSTRIGAASSTLVGVAYTAEARAGEDFDDLLVRADLALREAQGRGVGAVVLYEDAIGRRHEHRRSVDQQLRRALDADRLRIRFQPVIDLATQRVVGAEALLRLQGDGDELLSPAAFVDAAESAGLISRLGSAVLRAACEDLARLSLGDGFEMSVNVAPRQLADAGFAADVLAILADTGVGPRMLSLEITEGAFLGRNDASEANILELRDAGVRVGLDEFGGDTSLAHLRRFPLDFVKVDRSLIAGLGANYVDGTIVRAALDLAHKLGLVSVAVGVETDEQRHRLDQLRCDRAQGYLFGGVVTADELAALLSGD